MESIYNIAEWFLNKEPMTHKKVQKLCYYAQAWHYALKDEPLIDCEFEAWVHGPVSRTLYSKYSGSGFSNLKPQKSQDELNFHPEVREHLESTWETYGGHTGNALEALSHSEPPWMNARRGYEDEARCSNTIGHNDMKGYYRSIYAGDLETEA